MTTKKTDKSNTAIEPDKSPENVVRDVSKPAASKTAGAGGASQDNSTYEEYLFGRGVLIDGAKGQAWSDTTKGRVMIRLVSRGLVGAAAFALGNRYATEQLRNYHPDTWTWRSNPLQTVAKGFDTVFGKPISFVMKTVAPKGKNWGHDSVWFRSKAYYHDLPGKMSGRSLGAEMVAISFDFACASVGDAATRNIIQAFDPNIQKPWIKDGKFHAGEWIDAVGRSTWRVLTKNAGEDWAVALPYVYQMKWQRQALAKWFDGFKLTSDQAWNGGSFSINKQGAITGDYQLAGAIDLQCRFVGYNWYTLMYRDAYDAVSRGLKQWGKNGYAINLDLPKDPLAATVGGFGSGLRYVAKSWVKSNLYMQPATPFFWIFRTPQSKWRASPVNPGEKGVNGFDGYATFEPLRADLENRQNTAAHRLIPGGTWSKKLESGKPFYLGTKMVDGKTLHGFDPFAFKNQQSITGMLLNPFGALSYHAGSAATHYLEPLISGSKKLRGIFGHDNFSRETMLRSMTDASFAYTPYMIAKAEFGLRVDDRPAGGGLGDMDKAIYGAIDSLATFKFKDFGNYVKRISVLMEDTTHKEVISREGSVKPVGDGSGIPTMSKDPTTRIEKSSVVEHHKEALADKPKSQQNWKEYIADKREVAQLHPTHPTVQ